MNPETNSKDLTELTTVHVGPPPVSEPVPSLIFTPEITSTPIKWNIPKRMKRKKSNLRSQEQCESDFDFIPSPPRKRRQLQQPQQRLQQRLQQPQQRLQQPQQRLQQPQQRLQQRPQPQPRKRQNTNSKIPAPVVTPSESRPATPPPQVAAPAPPPPSESRPATPPPQVAAPAPPSESRPATPPPQEAAPATPPPQSTRPIPKPRRQQQQQQQPRRLERFSLRGLAANPPPPPPLSPTSKEELKRRFQEHKREMTIHERCQLAIEIEMQHKCHLTRYDTYRWMRDRGHIRRELPQPFYTPSKMQLIKKYYQTTYPDLADELGDHFESVCSITYRNLRDWLNMAKRVPGTPGSSDPVRSYLSDEDSCLNVSPF